MIKIEFGVITVCKDLARSSGLISQPSINQLGVVAHAYVLVDRMWRQVDQKFKINLLLYN